MEELITLPFRYFWAVAIVVSLFNAVNMWWRAQGKIRENPELAPGYRKLALAYAVLANVPWVVMGAGILVGGIPHMFYFFRPSDNDPYVLAYWLTNFLVYGVIANLWLFVGGGIEMLEKHPGALNSEVAPNTLRFKASWLLQGVGILISFALFYYFIKIPIIELPLTSK